ncbi:hypothetical protein LVD15_08145 [Fulvivirga maritima]|uniref:hypothetical protein n=1 Tax=Fulvivirga maritima TaxID=2904247 RepID=UPI001F3DB0EF|nr:hypothetical protein [Fulvivirga maritima]UII28386.1 hypothetical protein LVD15_08145 [Fulvivirga maritima]
MGFQDSIIYQLLFPKKSLNNRMLHSLKTTFTITCLADGFKLVSMNNQNQLDYKWSAVKDVVITKDGLEITTDSTQKISRKWQGWHQLIREVPQGYGNYNYEFVHQYLNSLEGCDICGLKAVYNNECLHCGTEVWSDDIKELSESKNDYVREEQLLWFIVGVDPEKIDINNKPENGFESNPNWKPLISKYDQP